MDILEDKHIKLRAIEPSDADLIYTWENDSTLWHAGNTIEPFSKHVINQYVKNAHLDLFQARQLRLMIDLKEKTHLHTTPTIGAIDLFEIDTLHRRAGVGILIADTQNRKKAIEE